jgi:hypothetical protein
MNYINRQPISRRTLLRGAGAAVSLPLLEAMFPMLSLGAPSNFKPFSKSMVKPVPRSIFFYVPNGVNVFKWMPQGEGTSYVMSPTLEPLSGLRKHFSVLTGMGHTLCTGGHSGADTWLTGADLTRIPGQDYANSLSIDQMIAEKIGQQTRFPSLEFGDMSGTGSAGHSHTLAFDRNGTPLPTENSPRRVFERLFVPSDAKSREAQLKRYTDKRSILDDVAEEAKALEKQLGKSDQTKLSEYLASVRETEQRVQRQVNWIDIPKPKIGLDGLQLTSQPMNGHDRGMWLDVMLELCYLAFVTDTTRVITFQWSREAGGYGGGGENHHELSHHGGDEGMLNKLAAIDKFHVSRLARFMGFLNTTEEGGRTMLDHTMVVFGSGMNSGEKGDHSPKNLPLIVGGGSAWGMKHGQHIKNNPNKHPPLSNVLLTVAQKMGVESNKFSDASGTMTGLY